MRILPAVGLVSSFGLASFGLAASGAPASAADLPSRAAPPVFVAPQAAGYDVTIAIGPQVLNAFPGAKNVTVLPSIHLGYRKAGEPDPFYTPDDAFSIAVYQNPYFNIGPAASYINRRGKCCGASNFAGLTDVGGTLTVGGYAEFYPLPRHLRIRGELLKGVTGSRGLVGNLGADAIQRMGPFEFSIGPRLVFGDQRYADKYFSVLPFEAAANGLITPYRASGGLSTVGGLATARYDINRQYSLVAFGGYSRLVDSMGNSPIPTVLGSKNQFTAGGTVSYTFNFGGFGILGY